MDFKSQICTSREQSERLLKIGLKRATADMIHQPIGATPFNVWDKSEIEDNFYPAWSLHRLMEIMYKGDMFGFVAKGVLSSRTIDNIYEFVIANIAGLININHFDTKYLEDKQ